MKTISLRTLLREPLKVKRMTRAGESVQVTDNGKPLWMLKPVDASDNEVERLRATDEVLDEVLSEQRLNVSAARLLEKSRR